MLNPTTRKLIDRLIENTEEIIEGKITEYRYIRFVLDMWAHLFYRLTQYDNGVSDEIVQILNQYQKKLTHYRQHLVKNRVIILPENEKSILQEMKTIQRSKEIGAYFKRFQSNNYSEEELKVLFPDKPST